MELQPSDIAFAALVIWIAIQIIGGNGGGGRRARVPAA